MMGLLIGLAVLSLFALILALAAWRLGEGMKEAYSDDCSANDLALETARKRAEKEKPRRHGLWRPGGRRRTIVRRGLRCLPGLAGTLFPH